jgi:hypothetical protein
MGCSRATGKGRAVHCRRLAPQDGRYQTHGAGRDNFRAEAPAVPGPTRPSWPTPRGEFTHLLVLHATAIRAALLDEAPTGSDWLHEVKYDGYRMQHCVK